MLYAASYQRRRHAVRLQRRRPGQRHLEDDRRRQDVDEADGQRPARRPDHRPHRPRRLPVEAERRSTRRSKSAPSGGTGAGVERRRQRCVPAPGEARRAAAGGGRRPAAAQAAPRPAARSRPRAASGARTMAGKTWQVMSNTNDRPMYYSQIRVDPSNPEIVYRAARRSSSRSTAARRSRDGAGHRAQRPPRASGSTRRTEPRDIGNDGGLDVSYDQGETWEFVNTMARRPVLRGQRRHAEAVLRVRRPAGQRIWCGPSADAQRRSAS